ncbi:MAG: carbohydrate ABC transporter permease [Clostridia bacterium]|nr:carbohydrate ABC transporter permease [Clostridia bacterium]
MQRSIAEKVFNVFNIIGFFLFTLLMLIPIMFVVKTSLDISQVGEVQLNLLPKEPSLLFYDMVIHDESVYRPFLNSIIITVLGTSLSMLINSIGAYTLSKRELPGNRFFIYFLVIIPMLFGGGIVPTYLLVRALGLIDHLPVLFIPSAANAWNMILIRNYYWSIPTSLAESARIDGAQEFTVFFKIILPLAKPVLAAIALFTGVGYWNTFMAAVLYIRDSRKYTFPVKLRELIILGGDANKSFEEMLMSMGMDPNEYFLSVEGLSSAMMIVSMIPIILVYPYLQKYFAKGIMVGSIKG